MEVYELNPQALFSLSMLIVIAFLKLCTRTKENKEFSICETRSLSKQDVFTMLTDPSKVVH